METRPQTKSPTACPTTAVVVSPNLVHVPPCLYGQRAFTIVIAISKAGNDEFLIGPIDQTYTQRQQSSAGREQRVPGWRRHRG